MTKYTLRQAWEDGDIIVILIATRRRRLVLHPRGTSRQPLHLLQEASGPGLRQVLRRVRDRRAAISWRYNNSIQHRHLFLQRTS